MLERQPGADAAGFAGLEDRVDNHWASILRAAGLSIVPAQAVKIVIATQPVDFRKGHDGLAAALQRKNALFAGHDEGGRTWGRIASLIETCKLNGVEPYAYLKATLEAIAAGHPASGVDELMPWNFKQNEGRS